MAQQIYIKIRPKDDPTPIESLDNSNDLVVWDSLLINFESYSTISGCSFDYKKYGSKDYTPEGGDEIGVWDGSTKIFGGTITNINKKIEENVLVFSIECKCWIDKLDRMSVEETFVSETVNSIITSLRDDYATDFDVTNVDCSVVVERINFDYLPFSQCLDALVEAVGNYYWYVSPEKEIYFFQEGDISAPYNITETNEVAERNSLKFGEDYEQIINVVKVSSTSIDDFTVEDSASIAEYGRYETALREDRITSTQQGQQMAEGILDQRKNPRMKGRFRTRKSGFFTGQTLTVTLPDIEISDDFVIQRIYFRALTPEKFVYDVDIAIYKETTFVDYFKKEITRPLPVEREDTFGNRKYTSDIPFTSESDEKISWTAGDIIITSGETYNIVAGNYTGASPAICYFNPTVSETELQFSTSFANGVGEDRVPIGYFFPGEGSDGAQFVPISFMGGIKFSGKVNILARTIIADQLSVNEAVITEGIQIADATIDSAHINGVLSVGATEADVTSDNPQSVDWLSDAGAMAKEDLVELAKLGTTIIDGGYIKTSLLDVDDIIVSGSIIVGGDSITDLSGRTANNIAESTSRKWASESGADVTGNNTAADSAMVQGETIISGGYIKTSLLTADNIEVGTLSGVDIQSSSGYDRIVLDNGDYLKFYKGNSLKATLRGTTTGNGGLFVEDSSDIYIENNNSFFIQDTTGADNKYGGITIDSDNDFVFIAGTTDDFYWYNNALDTMLANLNQDGDMYLAGFLEIAGGFQLGTSIKNTDGAMYYRLSDDVIRVRLGGTWYSLATV